MDRCLLPQICMSAKSLQLFLTLCSPVDYSTSGSSVHGDSLGKNTGVSCCALLHGVFPTQASNLFLMSPALAGRFFTLAPPRKLVAVNI